MSSQVSFFHGAQKFKIDKPVRLIEMFAGIGAQAKALKRLGLKIGHCRIRKLSPLECWRLMGFDDEDFYKAQAAGINNSQLYKQAGNSIVVNVLEAIFKQML